VFGEKRRHVCWGTVVKFETLTASAPAVIASTPVDGNARAHDGQTAEKSVYFPSAPLRSSLTATRLLDIAHGLDNDLVSLGMISWLVMYALPSVATTSQAITRGKRRVYGSTRRAKGNAFCSMAVELLDFTLWVVFRLKPYSYSQGAFADVQR